MKQQKVESNTVRVFIIYSSDYLQQWKKGKNMKNKNIELIIKVINQTSRIIK